MTDILKTLVLGGAGFIGSHLTDALLLRGHRVNVLDYRHELFRPPNSAVDYFLGSFEDQELLERAIQDCDLVYHLASTVLPRTSIHQVTYDVQSNVIGSINLFEKCLEAGVKKVVFISTGGAIYGEPQYLPINEQHPNNPLSSYGITKLTIEKYLGFYARTHSLPSTILRPSNPFGPRQNLWGEQGAVVIFMRKVAMGEPIEIWGDGSIVRDYFYIDDLVQALLLAGNLSAPPGPYNIGHTQGISLNQLLHAIADITGRDTKVVYLQERSVDASAVILDTNRAQHELNWSCQTSLETGLQQTWQWVQDVIHKPQS